MEEKTGRREKSIRNCSGLAGSNCSLTGVNVEVSGGTVLVEAMEWMRSLGLKVRISLGMSLTLMSCSMYSSSSGSGVDWRLVSLGV